MPVATSIQTRSRPTMVDVARAAGVSVTTVSYVLGGRCGDLAASRISDGTRRRVLEAVDEIKYRVNEPARNLRRNRTDRVLLLMDRLSSPYEQHLATVVESMLTETGRSLSIMVCTTVERLDHCLGMVRTGLADGAVVQGRAVAGAQEVLDAYARQHIPMVAISDVLRPNGFDVLANDEAQAIQEAVDSLVARGHRRIGFLSHDAVTDLSESRLIVARDRLAEHGIELPHSLVRPGARDRLAAFASARELLELAEPPTALFAASDTGAISAIWAALALGRRVPDDLAVIGCGNIDECQVTVPQLSSAGPDRPDFSAITGMLLDRLANPRVVVSRHVHLPWTFFARQSS